jgi:FixJ family two-component response regulator
MSYSERLSSRNRGATPPPVHLALREWNGREWNGPLTELPLVSIVDDDDFIRGAIETLVTSLGFAARTFSSAESFLQSSSVAETQCLILDVQMPQMSGLELQDRLAEGGADIPIIFITAYSDETTKVRALSAGAICFLDKSVDFQSSRFEDCLRSALRRGKEPAPAR